MSRSIVLCLPLFLGSCAGNHRTQPPAELVDPQSRDAAGGIGLGSAEIIQVADQMTRDILLSQELTASGRAPRLVMDSADLQNQSSDAIDVGLFTDTLRVELMRAAGGKLEFLAGSAARAPSERLDTARGAVGEPPSWDYRLTGVIRSRDARDPRSGMMSRFYVITMELVDRASSRIVWTNAYQCKRAGTRNVVYR